MPTIVEERIYSKPNHIVDVGNFNCGDKCYPLNNFIQGEAGTHDFEGSENTFLLYHTSKKTIVSYYTLRVNSILVKKEYLPLVEITKFAIDYEFQKNNLGRIIILSIIFKKILRVRELVGIKGILVACDNDVVGFYKKIGFELFNEKDILYKDDGFADDCNIMILKINEDFISSISQAYNTAVDSKLIDDFL